MAARPASKVRGRPPTITRERIANAGVEIGLPNITFVGVAAALGVSHMALYKHVANLKALKVVVAEEIFRRWRIPRARRDEPEELQAYLFTFAMSIAEFVKVHPGLTPYVIRRLAATQPMIEKIHEHQAHIAEVYEISQLQARWLLATVAFHCFAVADTIYSVMGQEPVEAIDHAVEEAELEAELEQGIQALIAGAIAMLDDHPQGQE
ncbi:TetR/AcrR family transcriptional regulator [Vreelandella alkaliphila]|uniref:TetR family transcriptional regulator n=1 Tax=Halomonas campaniensis TaxID=213554 RepID=A0A3D0KB76_9GAMM|nr:MULTISPECIES: TetR/AcrR family transcriptional regulator [unclassified Halomonas]WKD28157.1 TetR/AcrR family transcriptional regulator [Halomonas sp. KG2]HBS81773.1 TetR family transcriptional regulator [Halomonas campaniensis]HCA00714.1 TetR family transcriptional regulator [Halomonas campaniensis]